MSAIFGETLTFGYDGGEVRLVAFGDEHYHRLETPDGYTAVYDGEQRRYCYALVLAGRFVSTGVPVEQRPPVGLRRHLREASSERQRVRDIRRTARLPPRTIDGSTATLRTFGAANGLLPGRRCSTGDVVGLTILVRFRDVDTTVTADDVDQMLNRPGYDRNGNSGLARDYFLRVSNGRLRYQNRVVGPYTLAHERSHYVDELLLREALDLAVADGLDLRQFDSKHENIVDAINVLYAGQTQYLGNLWPHNGFEELRYGTMRTGLYLLTSLGRTASDLSIGTFCHENGHLLCRFPDMYYYGERDGDGAESAGIGSYCLMGLGNHLDHGRCPSPVCGYLRELAGWCEVIDLRSGGDFEAAHGDYGKVMKWETGRPNEYFIVENRSKLDQDRALPSSGLAVYHCDVLGSNEWQDGSAARHYQCALLQADGRLDLERNVNQGDGADLWSAIAGMALGHATSPSSRQWDGGESAILSAITPPGARIGFRVGAPSTLRLVRGDALPSVPIPDDNVAGVASTIAIADTGGVMSVAVSVDIAHTYVGDLVVELVAPDGRRAVLHDRAGGGKDDLITTFRSESVGALAAMVGVDARGSWRLVVRDAERVDVGVLRRWSIELALAAASPPVLRGEAAPAVAIPENDPVGVGSSIALRHPGVVGSVAVRVAIAHPYVGDLRVELLSPAGRRVILHNRLGGGQDDLTATYRSDGPGSPLAPLVGQAIEGSWVLRVADLAPRDRGTLTGWSIEVVPAP